MPRGFGDAGMHLAEILQAIVGALRDPGDESVRKQSPGMAGTESRRLAIPMLIGELK